MKNITMSWEVYQKEIAEAESKGVLAAWRVALKYLKAPYEDYDVQEWINQNEHGLSSIGKLTKHFCEEIQKLKKPPM